MTDLMRRQLHWLLIRERISYKLCTLAYKCLHSLAPSYLTELCVPVAAVPGRMQLRSAARGDLVIPATRTKNYWSTWFFICLSVGLERFAYAFERLFHHFHKLSKNN